MSAAAAVAAAAAASHNGDNGARRRSSRACVLATRLASGAGARRVDHAANSSRLLDCTLEFLRALCAQETEADAAGIVAERIASLFALHRRDSLPPASDGRWQALLGLMEQAVRDRTAFDFCHSTRALRAVRSHFLHTDGQCARHISSEADKLLALLATTTTEAPQQEDAPITPASTVDGGEVMGAAATTCRQVRSPDHTPMYSALPENSGALSVPAASSRCAAKRSREAATAAAATTPPPLSKRSRFLDFDECSDDAKAGRSGEGSSGDGLWDGVASARDLSAQLGLSPIVSSPNFTMRRFVSKYEGMRGVASDEAYSSSASSDDDDDDDKHCETATTTTAGSAVTTSAGARSASSQRARSLAAGGGGGGGGAAGATSADWRDRSLSATLCNAILDGEIKRDLQNEHTAQTIASYKEKVRTLERSLADANCGAESMRAAMRSEIDRLSAELRRVRGEVYREMEKGRAPPSSPPPPPPQPAVSDNDGRVSPASSPGHSSKSSDMSCSFGADAEQEETAAPVPEWRRRSGTELRPAAMSGAGPTVLARASSSSSSSSDASGLAAACHQREYRDTTGTVTIAASTAAAAATAAAQDDAVTILESTSDSSTDGADRGAAPAQGGQGRELTLLTEPEPLVARRDCDAAARRLRESACTWAIERNAVFGFLGITQCRNALRRIYDYRDKRSAEATIKWNLFNRRSYEFIQWLHEPGGGPGKNGWSSEAPADMAKVARRTRKRLCCTMEFDVPSHVLGGEAAGRSAGRFIGGGVAAAAAATAAASGIETIARHEVRLAFCVSADAAVGAERVERNSDDPVCIIEMPPATTVVVNNRRVFELVEDEHYSYALLYGYDITQYVRAGANQISVCIGAGARERLRMGVFVVRHEPVAEVAARVPTSSSNECLAWYHRVVAARAHGVDECAGASGTPMIAEAPRDMEVLDDNDDDDDDDNGATAVAATTSQRDGGAKRPPVASARAEVVKLGHAVSHKSYTCTDAYSGATIETPARSVHCEHFQCFDLRTFLGMQRARPRFECPICRAVARPRDLFVDELFATAVRGCAPNGLRRRTCDRFCISTCADGALRIAPAIAPPHIGAP